MSKVYIISSVSDKTLILEVKSSTEAKVAYNLIRTELTNVSMGVYGAKDLRALRRTQPTLPPARVTRSVNDFVENITTLIQA
jgi:hypothetical protein